MKRRKSVLYILVKELVKCACDSWEVWVVERVFVHLIHLWEVGYEEKRFNHNIANSSWDIMGISWNSGGGELERDKGNVWSSI